MALQQALLLARQQSPPAPPSGSIACREGRSSVRGLHYSQILSPWSSSLRKEQQKLQSEAASGLGNRFLRKRLCAVAAGDGQAADDASSSSGMVEVVEPTQAAIGQMLNMIQNANRYTPQVVLASTLLALIYPRSFTWFSNRYYAPALGFLMFAVGINLNHYDFIHAVTRPGVITLGYIGQFLIKPLLGFAFATFAMSYLHLPEPIGSGIILVSCVSGAQLSNYATFLVEPTMAPLSIVMTALSTSTAVFMTPALTLLLLGRRLPVDIQAMMFDITQIVIVPIAAGLALRKFASPIAKAIKPLLPLLSLLVTSLCMGSPLAANIESVRSPFGLQLLLPIIGFHSAAFIIGYTLAGLIFSRASDVEGLQRTLCLQTGMQSSLLGLTLANKFFADPLVGVPSAMSTVLMSIMGFGLVMYWKSSRKTEL